MFETFFFKAKNDFISDFTTLHRHYNLILALQLCIKRSYTTLYPEKISCNVYTRQQKYTNNNNRQREKRAGWIDSIVIEFYVCM